MMRTHRTLYPLLIIGLLLAGLGLAACASPVRTLPTPTPWPTPASSEKPLYTVSRGTMVDQFRLTGEVVPVIWEPVSFLVAGQLAALYVQEGDDVQEGDLLAELEMPTILEELTQARLTLEQAQDQMRLHTNALRFDLERARLEQQLQDLQLQRARQSGDAIEVTMQEVRLQLAELATLEITAGVDPTMERNVTKAQLAVEALERQVEERRLRAPFNGQVVAIGIGLEGTRSTPNRPQPRDAIPAYTSIMVVAEPTPISVILPGDRGRVAELTAGQVVTITHPWARNQPFLAEVTALPTTGSNPSSRPGFPTAVHIGLPAAHPPMAIGDFVDVTVLAAVRQDTLILPDAAVRRFAGRTFVVVQDGDRQKRLDIRVGLENVDQVEVLEGLQEGDLVIGR